MGGLAAVVLVGTCGGTAAAGSASVSVAVKLEGTAPAATKIKTSADPICQQQHPEGLMSEEVVVGGAGELKNVFVYVKEGLSGEFPAPAEAVKLDQKGCWYAPHVFGIQVGQTLEIVNSDPTMHNVNAKPTLNQSFNLAQPKKDMVSKKTFAKPELGVKFKCNVHPWMSAYGHVVAHPFFAVTDAHGAATLSGLPAGTYTLEFWHEKYGAQTQTVTVAEQGAATVSAAFKAP
jgi:plastocyanin